MLTYLEFESQIAALDTKISELRTLNQEQPEISIEKEIYTLECKVSKSLKDIYDNLNAWQKTQVARHPLRPHFLDYVEHLFKDFTPLSGDRKFGEDSAILAGPAWFEGERVMILGQEKGCDTASRVKHNFGMAKPEGYRKAARLMEMADHFSLPVITFIDTAGAYPGIGAEERGQAEAIAQSIAACLSLNTPLISVVIGEGGSGGAIALAAANRVLMLEHAIYGVISPEGAASILWRDSSRAQDAAMSMKITAQDLKNLQIIEEIIPEPLGGAHRNREQAIRDVGRHIWESLQVLKNTPKESIKKQRREKFIKIGKIS